MYQKNRSLAFCRLLALLKTKLTWLTSLSPHLTHFVVYFFAGCPCFRFAMSLIAGFDIGGAESNSSDIAIDFSG